MFGWSNRCMEALDVLLDISVDSMSLPVRLNDDDGDTPVDCAPVIKGKEYAKLAKWHTPI